MENIKHNHEHHTDIQDPASFDNEPKSIIFHQDEEFHRPEITDTAETVNEGDAAIIYEPHQFKR